MNDCRHCGFPRGNLYDYCPQCLRNHGGAVYPATQTAEELCENAEILARIHLTFHDVSLGGGETIHQADLEGCYRDEQMWLAEGAKDPESHWSHVPDWKLQNMSSTLSFFTVESWRYYLPAFMCWTLKHWRNSSSITSDSVIWTLTTKPGWSDYHLPRFQSLNRPQSEAVYVFLAHFDRYEPYSYDADQAIKFYWYQFKTE